MIITSSENLTYFTSLLKYAIIQIKQKLEPMATKIKPTHVIHPKPNYTGYQAVGCVKGKFTYLDDQTGANAGRGILKTKYGDFPSFVHIKCRAVVDKLYSKAHHFLVWFRNRLPTEDNSATVQFTIVGCGSEGTDNTFLVTGALIGGSPENKSYQFVLARNKNSKIPTKHKVKFSTRNFRVRVSADDDLWELYRHKLAALVCKLVDGKLVVVSHQLISDEVPDKSILKSLKKKLKKKNDKVITVVPSGNKPLVKKKITVGVISDPVGTTKKVLPAIKPVRLPTTEPLKKKVLELPKR